MDCVSKSKKATISIKGMTCNSCVKTIEQNLGEFPGVLSIKVSLSNEEGVVIFSPLKTNADTLVQEIEDSGFEASLKSVFEAESEEEPKCEANDKNMVSIELHEGMSFDFSSMMSIQGWVADKVGQRGGGGEWKTDPTEIF